MAAAGEPFPASPPTLPSPPPPESPPAMSGGVGRRLLRALFAPIRFARRRPARAALYLALCALVLGLAAVAGAWVWFAFHLRAARAELDRGHNAAAVQHL